MISSNSRDGIYFIGTRGYFSTEALQVLLHNEVPVTQVICAGFAPTTHPGTHLPVSLPVPEQTLDSLAHQQHIPVTYVNHDTDFDTAFFEQHAKTDFIFVACFPFRLSTAILDWPRIACINIHPSLLPRYRGPDPVFWQLHGNESQTGVSLHLVTADIDTGPLVAQTHVPFDDGASQKEIETKLAITGAKLFVDLFITLSADEKVLQDICARQNEEYASYYPMPSIENYELNPQWGARHAFNFIRGTCSPTQEYSITLDENVITFSDAITYDPDGQLGTAFKVDKNGGKDKLLIQLSPGILQTDISSIKHKTYF